MYSTAILQAQHAAEALQSAEGVERYYAQQARKGKLGGFDKLDAVQQLMRGAIPILSSAIGAWLEAHSVPRRGGVSAALAPLQALVTGKEDKPDTDKVALIGLSKVFAGLERDRPVNAIAISIGRTIQMEVEALAISETDPKAAAKYAKLIEAGVSDKKALERHESLVEALQVGLQWKQRTQLLVGRVVLNLILESLEEIFERCILKTKAGELPGIKLTAEAQEALVSMDEAVAWSQPILRPMFTEPRRWERFDTGAYLKLGLSRSVPLVRTYSREHQKLIRAAIKDGSMRPTLDALNAIQETAFAIDTRVLEIEKWAKAEGLQPSDSFPLSELPKVGEKMSDDGWAELTQEARIALTRERATKRNIIAAAATNAGVFKNDIAEADRLSGMPFYLPHSMDSRGRVYAVPHFNPQRSDHIKALFRFADSVPMGPHGFKWLAIHLANCGDFKVPSGRKASKAPFDERVAWVLDNQEMILGCARDPQGTYETWAEADSPFCFLQACFEWAEFYDSGYSHDFPGTIAIALDGSCSGLQHYSAMNRAEQEAYHVNLVPRPDVGDIYQVVADEGTPGIRLLATRGDLAASTILANGFGRSEVKRNVMTYFYGSGKFGMRDQHMEDTMRPLADQVALGKLQAHPYALMTDRKNKETGETTTALDGGFTCAQMMASAIHGAVVSVAPKADEAASWFQGVAAALAHESLPVIWTTPMGLPVVQRYSEYTSKTVNFWLYDRAVRVPDATKEDIVEGERVLTRVRALIREAPTKRIDKKKARSAIAPNVVHSLDAAHLQRVAVKGREEGYRHFLFIHDSFGTHAGNTERFSMIIREALVEQYETYCPFEALEAYARTVLSAEGIEKLEKLEKPKRGNLDLKSILEAEYAFA